MKLNIVIADDNPQFRTSFKLLLKNLPEIDVNEVYETTNGRECIEIVEQKHIQVVFMDADMPVMNGETAIKYLRNQNRFVKIFAISFHNEFDWIKKMLDAGATNYFIKDDINIDHLIKAIKN